MLLLGFSECLEPARRLAQALNCDFRTIDIHTFPDGESLVTLPSQPTKTLVLFRSLNNPNAKLVELLLACNQARRLGCERLVLVAPYLCYMRQDKAFKPGQAVSQHIIGEQLSKWVDDLITVDPHLHRIRHLNSALPYCKSIATTAARLLGEFVKSRGIEGVLVGPDEESRQWVEQVASASGLDFVVAAKQRLGDREVSVTLPSYPYQGRDAFLVDDVISSGKTMMETAAKLLEAGARSVSALCTHALFAPGAEQGMRSAGIHNIWSGNAIIHPSNSIDLTPVLAKAVHEALGEN